MAFRRRGRRRRGRSRRRGGRRRGFRRKRKIKNPFANRVGRRLT